MQRSRRVITKKDVNRDHCVAKTLSLLTVVVHDANVLTEKSQEWSPLKVKKNFATFAT